MKHIGKYSLIGIRSKTIILLFVWLLLGNHTNKAMAQSHLSEVEYKYPYLWTILEQYCKFNLSGPKNVNELVEFIKIHQSTFPEEHYLYRTLNKVTIPLLFKNEYNIYIVQDKCQYAMFLNDTLLYSYSDFPCCYGIEDYYLEEQPIMLKKHVEDIHFFKDGHIPMLDKNSLTNLLLKELRVIYPKHTLNKEKIVFLKFTTNENLSDYCSLGINLNDDYYKEISTLLYAFCVKYDIREIFLYTYLSE